jgi:site-specific recombinase XerD
MNEQAVAMMGQRRGDDERVFREFPQNNNIVSDTIKRWVLRAGIRKNITFHCARHTFAVMMLDIGTDIYTVSKLLGHRELATTQIYARVLDKNKQKAVQNIPSIFE